MSLSDLASFGSLVSSVAVLVSLVFIGLQIRQSNRNQRSLMQQGRSARNVELLARLSDPRLSDIMLRVSKGETLTDTDYFSLVRLHGVGYLELRGLLLSVSFGHARRQELGVRRYYLETLARQSGISSGLEVRAGWYRRRIQVLSRWTCRRSQAERRTGQSGGHSQAIHRRRETGAPGFARRCRLTTARDRSNGDWSCVPHDEQLASFSWQIHISKEKDS